MTNEESLAFFQGLRDEVKPLYRQAEVVSAASLRVRPVFLGKQPFPKRCEMMRKALAMKINAEASGEILATYFMEKHKEELGELLDLLKIEHEEGSLKNVNPPQPEEKLIKSATKKFLAGEKPALRSVILKAFAGQSAIDWPVLDEMLFGATAAKVASEKA
jgi:hypothetical protein